MNSPVVVTGASGFLGSALVTELARQGQPVIAVSRQSGQAQDSGQWVQQWVQLEDYADTPCPEGACLVHLAEESDVATANARGGTHCRAVEQHVLALLGKPFLRTVYVSSARVYDKSDYPYARAKRRAEQLVLGAGGTIARLTNVYGPRMNDNTLITDILAQVPGDGALLLLDASARVDFLWIGDAAAGLAAIALGPAIGAFDLCTGEAVKAATIAQVALDAAGQGARSIESTRKGPSDCGLELDPTPVAQKFGWHAKVDIATGLIRMMELGD